MASDWAEELLESVAEEFEPGTRMFGLAVLNRRLADLLRAGRACQQNLEYHDGTFDDCPQCEAYKNYKDARIAAEQAVWRDK
ncbi:MAG: hypothetical protein WBA09_22165 [Candidatus Acidiferrum sp.]